MLVKNPKLEAGDYADLVKALKKVSVRSVSARVLTTSRPTNVVPFICYDNHSSFMKVLLQKVRNTVRC